MTERWIGVDQLATRFLTLDEYQEHRDNIARGETGRMKLKCPHCRSTALVRSSRELSPLLREAYYQCNNIACGHTFKANVEVVLTLSPSSCPNPAIASELDRDRRVRRAIEQQQEEQQQKEARLAEARRLAAWPS